MAEASYIAVDLGAESGRVMLGTVSDGQIALAEVHRFPNVPVKVGRTLHWDILRLWGDILAGIGKAVAQAGQAGGKVAGIGVDTWGVDFGLLAEDGTLLGNPVCYRDERTVGMPEKVFAKIPKEQVYAATGIQTMTLNTLFQLAALAESGGLKHAKHLLFTPDLIAYWLTGRMANEYTIASTSQMLDAKARTWWPELLGALGIPRSLFPGMILPATKDSRWGTVQPAIGEALGATGIPVLAVGSHDTASAVAAIPASEGDDWLYLSSGTWSLLGAEVAEPVLSDKALRYNVTNEGGVGGKIRLLKNIVGMYPLQECRRAWAAQGRELDYGTLVQMAEKAAPHTAILDLSDPALNTPGQMPEKIAAHCRRTGESVPQEPGQVARVILETLAVTYARTVRELMDVTGKTFRRLHIVGGGSQNQLLNQMAADATGLTVYAGPVEATALGNVMSQAITTGQLGSIAAGRALIRRGSQVREFTPRDTGAWKKWIG